MKIRSLKVISLTNASPLEYHKIYDAVLEDWKNGIYRYVITIRPGHVLSMVVDNTIMPLSEYKAKLREDKINKILND